MDVAEFKKALKKVYEIDLNKIIEQKYRDCTKPKRYLAQEKKRAKRDREFLNYIASLDTGIEGAHFVPLLMELRSTEVLKNVICYMITAKKGENEK